MKKLAWSTTWNVQRYGQLPALIVNENDARSIGWFDSDEEATAVCETLNRLAKAALAKAVDRA